MEPNCTTWITNVVGLIMSKIYSQSFAYLSDGVFRVYGASRRTVAPTNALCSSLSGVRLSIFRYAYGQL